MKHSLSILAFFFLANFAFGQTSTDTVYFDSEWEKASKDNYEYYRVLSRVSSDLYDFKDYWNSGEIRRSGRLSSTHPQTREGEFTWYLKNGNITQIANYKNGQIFGHIQAFDSSGKFDYEYIPFVDSLDNANEMNANLLDFSNHISRKTKYPKKSQRRDIEGVVLAEFYINASGKVSGLTLIKAVNEEIDSEAIRVIKSFKEK